MREILFRGKRTRDGEWVEGSLLIDTYYTVSNTEVKHYRIINSTYGEEDTIGLVKYQIGCDVVVDPDTVSQFTGLYDRNGRKVFEGDILINRSNWFKDHYGVVKYGEFNDGDGFPGVYGWGCTDEVNICDLFPLPPASPPAHINTEVIGNIWDNPELFEKWRET